MITEIRQYIKDHHDKFGNESGDADRLYFLEIETAKRMRTDKSVYKLLIDGEPRFVAKFFPDTGSDHSIIQEYENLLSAKKMGLEDLTPSPVLVKIRDKNVVIEKYLRGVTIQEVFKKKLFMTRSFLVNFAGQILPLIKVIHDKLNSSSKKAGKADLKRDIDVLIEEYCEIFGYGNPDKIRKITDAFVEKFPGESIRNRIVLFDAFPCNILFDPESKKAYLIDLEYMGYSTFNFLEPLRATFSFIKYSHEFTNILLFAGGKNPTEAFFEGKGWLGSPVREFLRENTVMGSTEDFGFHRGLMLIFFMMEAVIQQKATP